MAVDRAPLNASWNAECKWYYGQMNSEQRAVVRVFDRYLRQLETYADEKQVWERESASYQLASAAACMRAQLQASPLRSAPVAPAPPHVFLTGPGGTGKSFVIKCVYALVRAWADRNSLRYPSGRCGGIVVCGPTGVSAFTVGGATLHHAFRLPVQHRGADTFERLTTHPRTSMIAEMEGTVVLVIDEMSMVSDKVLSYVDLRARELWKSDQVFGGVATLFVGDDCQLPPVGGKPVYFSQSRYLITADVHLFRSYCHPMHLVQPVRQQSDLVFGELLMRVRDGSFTEDDIMLLQTRMFSKNQREYLSEQRWRGAVALFPTNKKANDWNSVKLRALAREKRVPVFVFGAVDTDPSGHVKQTVDSGQSADATGGLMHRIELCVGASVMLRRNVDVSDGLHNGACGTVMLIEWEEGQQPAELDQAVGEGRILTVRAPLPRAVWVAFANATVGMRHSNTRTIDGRTMCSDSRLFGMLVCGSTSHLHFACGFCHVRVRIALVAVATMSLTAFAFFHT